MLMTKERELKEAVREGRDRVRRFDFFFFLGSLLTLRKIYKVQSQRQKML